MTSRSHTNYNNHALIVAWSAVPETSWAFFPPLKTMIVGTARMPTAAATSADSSTSTL